MRLRARGGPFPVVLVAAAVLLSGCGGGGDHAAARAVGSAPRVPATVAPPTVAPSTSAPPPVATTGGPLATDRSFVVGVTDTTFVDSTRPTSATDGFAGAPTRTFPVRIWYPATGDADGSAVSGAPPALGNGPYPLVVFSHGYGVTPAFYAALLSRWARAGYVVVAPTYPLLSGIPVESHADYVDAFADTTFVISKLLGVAAGPAGSSPLAGLVDAARVGVAGHSDGEAVAYGMGFLECCRDTWVKAVIAMAGNLSNIQNPVQRENGVPLLHLMGDADELQPYAASIASDRDNLGSPHWSVTVVGGTHVPPYTNAGDPHFAGVVAITTAFLDGTLKSQPERLAAIDTTVAADPGHFRVER